MISYFSELTLADTSPLVSGRLMEQAISVSEVDRWLTFLDFGSATYGRWFHTFAQLSDA